MYYSVSDLIDLYTKIQNTHDTFASLILCQGHSNHSELLAELSSERAAWHTESYWPCWVLLALAWPFGAIWCDGNAKDSETHRHPSFFPKHPGLGKCWKFAPELQFRRSRRSPQKNTHRWSHRHVQIWAVPVSSAQTSSTAWSRIVSCSAPPCETLGKEWDAVMICATFLVYDQRTCLTHGLAWVCCEAISNCELVDKQ